MFSLFNVGSSLAQRGGTGPGGPSGGTGPGTTEETTNPIDEGITINLKNPLDGSGVNNVTDFIKRLVDIILTIAIPVIAIFLIYSGFLFVTARGNGEKLTHAKLNLLYAVIGAALILGAWVLAEALGSTVNELQKP